ncbi:MAG: glycosyltransferase family 4 protein [Bryobacterales bacterium]|nr:glycosyltransferase family 4 protein [Bryobacterales bacterium]
MRILLLSQWYPPEPMKFLSEMTETLQALGHEVTVLTGFPNWPSGKLHPGYRLRLWQREEQNGIQIIRVPLFPDHSRSALKRALNFVSFAISATVLGLWLSPRPDVMHVIHPPITIGLPALVLSFLWRIPFTLEIQDMWPETLRATGMIRREAALRAVGAFAKLVYRRACAIRVISPGFRRNLIEKGVPASKVRVISNWVDADFYRPSQPDRDLAQKLGLEGCFTVMYAGTIGLAQGLDVVLDAAERLRDLPRMHFVLAGDGVEYERIRAEAESRNLANVRFLGRVPNESTPALYALADVLFLHLRNDPLFHITIPHKVFTYMASGKMVLAAMKGDVEELVRSSGCGVVCPPDDAEALASAIRDCYGLSPAGRAAFGENGRHAVCESYDRRQLVERVGAMMEQAARSPVTQYPG